MVKTAYRIGMQFALKEANVLRAGARKALPKGDFVFPKERRYPIENASHARAALSRVSQFGSPAEKAKVRAAVHSKYPGIGEK